MGIVERIIGIHYRKIGWFLGITDAELKFHQQNLCEYTTNIKIRTDIYRKMEFSQNAAWFFALKENFTS